MLKDYYLRSDLAIQNYKRNKYNKINSYISYDVNVKYYTYSDNLFVDLIFENIELESQRKKLKSLFKRELKKFLNKHNLNNNSSCLVMGLGNINVLCDSLGPSVCKYITPTGHLKKMFNSSYREVYVSVPNVLANTGITSFKILKSLNKELKVDFIIIIDSLICSHIKYLNKVIEITDKGITPGSGLSNYQEEISYNSLGIPVIVIGVPTTTYASVIIRDALKIKKDHFTFKEGYDFIVTTKDTDYFIKMVSKIVGEGINEVLNTFTKK